MKYKNNQVYFLIAISSSRVKDISVSSSQPYINAWHPQAAHSELLRCFQCTPIKQAILYNTSGFNISKTRSYIPNADRMSAWVLVWEMAHKIKLLEDLWWRSIRKSTAGQYRTGEGEAQTRLDIHTLSNNMHPTLKRWLFHYNFSMPEPYLSSTWYLQRLIKQQNEAASPTCSEVNTIGNK